MCFGECPLGANKMERYIALQRAAGCAYLDESFGHARGNQRRELRRRVDVKCSLDAVEGDGGSAPDVVPEYLDRVADVSRERQQLHEGRQSRGESKQAPDHMGTAIVGGPVKAAVSSLDHSDRAEFECGTV